MDSLQPQPLNKFTTLVIQGRAKDSIALPLI